jgi:hypothetical protein
MSRKKQIPLRGAVAAATSASVAKYIEKHPEVIEYAGRKAKTAINVGLILFGVGIVSTAGALYYNLYWKNRFRKMEFDPNQRPATISAGLAKSKADILYRAMHGIGANYTHVYNALKGMGHNNYVAIYNAFGKRTPASSFSLGNKNDMDLNQWLVDQFSGSELSSLRAQVGNGFF